MWLLDSNAFMRQNLLLLVISLICLNTKAQNLWELDENGGIVWQVKSEQVPHYDHIEMSGQYISSIIRWGVNADRSFYEERSLVFPMLRTIPNDTHASLMHRVATDVPSLLSVNGKTLKNEQVQSVAIHGVITVKSIFTISNHASGDDIELTRKIFPSYDKAAFCEVYQVKNLTGRNITLYIPGFTQQFQTPFEKGIEGSYSILATIEHSGTYVVKPNESQEFKFVINGKSKRQSMTIVDAKEELAIRMQFINEEIENNLVLETPDPVINAEFQFAKLRASESIYKTKGGYMHGPGGESYYAAIWANDQAEYVNPFFPYLGYSIGNQSALNAYLHFARFMNNEYKPIPSSIIAEGDDIWDGAGDRGDAAMIAYGASRYALERGDRQETEQLWPLIEWCLEYCHRKLNAAGVVCSDSDELEGRFPSGDANLCTSSLYYDALISASYLCKELGKSAKTRTTYIQKAKILRQSIENYFGKDLYGFHTYQYYEGNNLLRSWICIPLTVGILDRSQGTMDALFSDYLWHDDGLLTQQDDSTYWDRSTLYALRGAYIAGQPDKATKYLHYYSNRRLLGNHVPYPIEAFPEGSQRHLSAESGLYCRIITEGLFGIRPTGFKQFELKPQIPSDWNHMRINHIRAFGDDFNIIVERKENCKINVTIVQSNGKTTKHVLTEGESIQIKLK